MLAYASYHKTWFSSSRNKPFIRFPCFESFSSASNLLITVADSISTSSLSDNCRLRKLFPFPLVRLVSRVLLLAYPHTSTASIWSWCSLRNPLQAHLGYYENSVPMQGLLPV